MADDTAKQSTSPEITGDELFAAYKRAKLRYVGVSYATAIMTPHINKAMRMDAAAMKKKQQQQNTETLQQRRQHEH
jgi:hypothetical protein